MDEKPMPEFKQVWKNIDFFETPYTPSFTLVRVDIKFIEDSGSPERAIEHLSKSNLTKYQEVVISCIDKQKGEENFHGRPDCVSHVKNSNIAGAWKLKA